MAYSPHLSGIGQPHVREVRDGGGVQIDQNVGERGRLLRLERATRISRELSVARGSPQCAGGPAFAPPEQSCRLATSPMAFSPGDERLSNASGCGSVCVVSKLPTPQLLCFSPRSSRGGSRRFQFQVDSAPVPLRISSSDSDIAHSAENDSRAPANDGAASASMDGTNLVANTHVDDVGPSDTTSQRRMDHSGPDGQPDVAVPMASSRILFIRRFAAGNGISQKVLERRWSDIKNGYNKAYDKPFEAFRVWFETTHPDDEFSPTTISSGLLCDYLLYLKEDRGVHYDLIRYASSSISMACAIATDGEIQQGNSPSVTALLKGFRIHRPIKLKGTSGTYSDVVLLYEQAWLYGPTSALTPRHKRERALILLAADTACRPSDLCKLFRVFEGTQRQIVYSETGMRIRFFWPKEADPGSARQNTTNYFFSKWVEVHDTLPAVISTPAVLRDFIADSSGPEFAQQYIPDLESWAQPLMFAAKKKDQWQPASVDTVAKLVKTWMTKAGMENMTARSLRGASPSKIYQLFPDLLQPALDLGRWTTPKTFLDRYHCPVNVRSNERPPDSLKDNPQQILRWGFTPQPPPHVTAEEYYLPPAHWLQQTFSRDIFSSSAGTNFKVVSFDGGVYKVQLGRKTSSLYHYELMARISEARDFIAEQ